MGDFAGLDVETQREARIRGQQLKEQAQLDSWLRDGSAAAIEQLCIFG